MISVLNNGIEEPLTGVIKDSCEITESHDGYSMSFQVIKLEDDRAYSLIEEDAQIVIGTERYTIVDIEDMPPIKTVTCVHEFYDIIDDYVEGEMIEGIYTIHNALSKTFSASRDWSYVVADTFSTVYLSGFGNNNPVALFQRVLEEFNAEFELSSANKTVTVKKQVGTVTDEQVRYKHNLVSIKRHIDASNVKTACKVYYAQRDDGTYAGQFTYQSPSVSLYRRVKWAEPLYLDKINNSTDARNAAINYLQDKPIVSITAEFIELQNAGYSLQNIKRGDAFWLIDERIDEFDRARVVEIKRYPLSDRTPIVTFANRTKSMIELPVEQQQQYNALDSSVVKQKRLYNGVTISAEYGVKVTRSDNAVVTMLNATEGILITHNGIRKFYVDINGNVTFDGRLLITNGDGVTPMLEAYLDTWGGRLLVYDKNGNLNVKLGSEVIQGASQGGLIHLFSDSNDYLPKVALDIVNGSEAGKVGSGRFVIRDSSFKERVRITSSAIDDRGGGMIEFLDANGSVISYFNMNEAFLKDSYVATEAWVEDYVNSKLDSGGGNETPPPSGGGGVIA